MSWRMTLKTALVGQPSNSRNRTESWSITPSSGLNGLQRNTLCFQLESSDSFFSSYLLFLLYCICGTLQGWNLVCKIQEVYFPALPFYLCCSFILKSHFREDLWTHFRSRKLGFQIAPSICFCPVPGLSPPGFAFAQANQRKLAFSETSVQQAITLSSRH